MKCHFGVVVGRQGGSRGGRVDHSGSGALVTESPHDAKILFWQWKDKDAKCLKLKQDIALFCQIKLLKSITLLQGACHFYLSYCCAPMRFNIKLKIHFSQIPFLNCWSSNQILNTTFLARTLILCVAGPLMLFLNLKLCGLLIFTN